MSAVLTTTLPAGAAVVSLLAAAAGAALLRHPGGLGADPPTSTNDSLIDRLALVLCGPVRPLLASPAGRRYRSFVGRTLVAAGYRDRALVPHETQLHAGVAVLSAVIGLGFALAGQPILGFAVGVVGAVNRPVRLVRWARRRQTEMERMLPLFLELMAVLMRAGHSFRYALARVSERLDGPLSDEIGLMLAEVEFGRDVRDALERMAERATTPTLQRLVGALMQNVELGSPIGEMLDDIAEEARAELVLEIRLLAERNERRASFALTVLLLPGILAMVVAILLNEILTGFAGLVQLAP